MARFKKSTVTVKTELSIKTEQTLNMFVLPTDSSKLVHLICFRTVGITNDSTGDEALSVF